MKKTNKMYSKYHNRVWKTYLRYKAGCRITKVITCLEAWVLFDKETIGLYDYSKYNRSDFTNQFHYCSDRMNGGRAFELLEMLKR